MNLSRMLTDISERLPNAFDESVLVSWINAACQSLYKVLAPRDAMHFIAPPGQTLIPLPADIRGDSLAAVVVGGKERPCRRIGEEARGEFWFYAAEGFLGLYPVPPSGTPVTLLYFAKPAPLLTREEAGKAGVDFSTQSVPLDTDFTELVTLGVLITMAEAQEDVALANNFKASYNQLLARARQERYEKDGKYPTIRQV